MKLSNNTEKIIYIIFSVLGVICCLAVGLVLLAGINGERNDSRYALKYEFYEAIRAHDSEKVGNMLETDGWLANEALSETSEEYSKHLNDDTPLIAARGDADITRMLVDHGADTGKPTPITGRYPLTVALADVYSDRYNDADFYIYHGADVTVTDRIYGSLPYAALSCLSNDRSYSASQKAVLGYVKTAVERGVPLAMPDTLTTQITSLLGVAAQNGYYMAVEYLITEAGFDIDGSVTVDGRTALMVAMENKEYDTFRTLLELGADTYVKDNAGHDVYYYAETQADLLLRKMLIN